MKTAMLASLCLALGAMTWVGCASHSEEGVKSSYRSQWTTVAANTEDTTDAAEAVLNDEGLKNVTSSSTRVDGKAMGKKADGTEVKVAVERQSDTTSQVSVTVGTLGDPELGANLAKKIKVRAEGNGATTRPMTGG